jgi:hypothetical protein
MFKNILSYFDTQDWKYHIPEPTKTVAWIGIGTESGKYHCIADVNEDLQRFIFFTICPTNIPLSKRREFAELIARINYNLFLGNFEIDFEDGEVRFKTSIVFESVELTSTIIDNIITSNLSAMDKNIGLITTFAFGGLSIEEAVKVLS